MSRQGLLICLLAGAPILAGCPPVPKCPESHLSLEALAAEYNANAGKVPRLWARAQVRLTLSDEKGRSLTWGSVSPVALANAQLRLWKGKKRSVRLKSPLPIRRQ